MMEGHNKVLVLVTEKMDILNTTAVTSRHKTEFNYVFNERVVIENGKPRARNLLEQYNDCCQILQSQKFVAVLANGGDLSALVQAALVETFPWIEGPSVESVFLCWNKHYSRKMLDCTDLNVPYATLNAKEKQDLIQKTSELNWPLVVKPPCSTRSEGVAFVEREEDLKTPLSLRCAQNDRDLAVTSSFLSKFLDLDKYHLAKEPLAILEEKVDYYKSGNVSICSADVLCANGEVIPWCLHDNFYWPQKPLCVLGWGCPSQLDSQQQSKVWDTMKTLADLLKKYGYGNQFLNAEVFIWKNGDVKILELNPRIPQVCALPLLLTHKNGDMFHAATQLSQGVIPERPQHNQNSYALQASLETFAAGKASDLVNFDGARQYENKIPLVVMNVSEESVLPYTGAHHVLGLVTVSGKTVADCMAQMHQLKYKVLKKHSETPWFDTDATELPVRLHHIEETHRA